MVPLGNSESRNMTIGLLMLTGTAHGVRKDGHVAAKTAPRACREKASIPEEHVEEVGPEGGRFHLRWIPETDHERYINANSALNLSSRAIGNAGDWHQAGWWVPCEHGDEGIHFATMSTDTEWAEAVRDIQRTLGELELADAREALRDIGHPAGSRHGPSMVRNTCTRDP